MNMWLDAAYLVADPDDACVDANDAALELLGIDIAALRTLRVGDLAAPAAGDGLQRVLGTTVTRPGAWQDGVTDLIRADGATIHVRFAAVRGLDRRLVVRIDSHDQGGPHSSIQDVLQAWRCHEQRSMELPPGTAAHLFAETEAAWLGAEYQRLVAARLDEHEAQI